MNIFLKTLLFSVLCFGVFGFANHSILAAPTTEAECGALTPKPGRCVFYSETTTTGLRACDKNETYNGICEEMGGKKRACCVSKVATDDTTCRALSCGNTVTGICKAGEVDVTGNSKACGEGYKQAGACSGGVCCVPNNCDPYQAEDPPTGDPSSTTASLDYTPLENLPGFEDQGGDFGSYFKSLYLLALWIVGISALFMLVVGGFLYLSSAGNTATLGFAKKTIYAALIGLVIALISWLLLDTINSDLTNLKLSELPGAVGGGPAPGTGTPRAGTGPGGSTTSGTYTDAEARAALSAAGIGVKENNTSLEKIPKAAIDNLIAIKNECSCTVFVTGGTETAGHVSHGPGKPIVDLRQDPALGNFLYSRAGGSGNAAITKSPGYGISKMCVTREWEKLTFNCGSYREPSSSPHYHLVF